MDSDEFEFEGEPLEDDEEEGDEESGSVDTNSFADAPSFEVEEKKNDADWAQMKHKSRQYLQYLKLLDQLTVQDTFPDGESVGTFVTHYALNKRSKVLARRANKRAQERATKAQRTRGPYRPRKGVVGEPPEGKAVSTMACWSTLENWYRRGMLHEDRPLPGTPHTAYEFCLRWLRHQNKKSKPRSKKSNDPGLRLANGLPRTIPNNNMTSPKLVSPTQRSSLRSSVLPRSSMTEQTPASPLRRVATSNRVGAAGPRTQAFRPSFASMDNHAMEEEEPLPRLKVAAPFQARPRVFPKTNFTAAPPPRFYQRFEHDQDDDDMSE